MITRERFERMLDELDGSSIKTLKEKNRAYSREDDPLHNFRMGAEIMGGTPAQACWGYMTKHQVALRDMVKYNDFSSPEQLLEKCQDSINYIRFLYCIGMEEYEKRSKEGTTFTKTVKPSRRIVCDCYDINNMQCLGTKERESCTCHGDIKQCTFYPEKRGE